MKQFILILLSLFCVFFICYGCSSQKYMLSGVNLLSEADGTITVRSIGTGNNKENAIIKSEINAITILLFRGVPSSQQNTPILSIDETEAKKTYKKYFDELFIQGRYKTFIMSSIPVGIFTKHGRAERDIPVDITINLKALKNDLENHGIVRKFGY